MGWEILAWAAVTLLTVFRIAVVIAVVAVAVPMVRSLHAAARPVRHAGAPARK